MALIRSLSKVSKDKQRRHQEVDGGWSVVTLDGETYFQLDTYGTDDRQDVATISQSFQVSRDQAGNLIRILRETFPGL